MARKKSRSKTSVSWWHDIKADWTKWKKWQAKRRVLNNKLAKERAEAAKVSAAEKAKRQIAADQKRVAREKAATARRTAAEARRRQAAARPTVVTARVTTMTHPAPPPKPRPTKKTTAPRPAPQPTPPGGQPAPAVPCGARTQDGTPCQHPSLGGTCAAGHRPKGQPTRPAARPTSQPRPAAQPEGRSNVTFIGGSGYTDSVIGKVTTRNAPADRPARPARPASDQPQVTFITGDQARVGQQIGHVNGPATAGAGGFGYTVSVTGDAPPQSVREPKPPRPTGRQRPVTTSASTHDVFGRPLTAADREFYRLRETGYKGPITFDYKDGKPVGLPYKVDQNGNRIP